MLAARQFLEESNSTLQNQAKAKLRLLNQERVCHKKQQVKRVKVRVTATVIAIFLIALAYTAMEAQITMYGYEINSTKLAIADIENTNAKLLLQVEELSSPQRIANYAITQLGMVQPTSDHILYKKVGMDIAAAGSAVVADSGTSTGMDTVVPTASSASVTVIKGEGVHPIFATISKFISQYKNAVNAKEVGMLTN